MILNVKLPHNLPKDVRLRNLGNEEILGKSESWAQNIKIWQQGKKTDQSQPSNFP